MWNIPKGFVSLGAELFDLVADTNTAKDVEEWFDNVLKKKTPVDKNKKITNIVKAHEFFYEQSN